MIRKVSFRNFKAYRSLDVELEPFTVLVGPNASGKTTLLEGLYVLSAIAQYLMPGSHTHLPLPAEVRSYGAKGPVEVNASGEWKGNAGSLNAVSESEPRRDESGELSLPFRMAGVWDGQRFFAGVWPERSQATQDQTLADLDAASRASIQAELSSTAVLRFQPERLAEASYSEDAVPAISQDGSGLASLLAHIKLSQDEVFSGIEQALREVVPAVRRVRLERAQVEQTIVVPGNAIFKRETKTEVRKVWGNKLVLDMQGANGVAADAVGEGTLMALGLLTVLMAPPHPRLILLDDIELKLHPAAQAKLIAALRAIQDRDPQLQIVATSHSPFILNYLDPKEVRMTFLTENGFARCEKLAAHPEFEKWKDLMTPGEFWSTVGESWLEKVGETSAHE